MPNEQYEAQWKSYQDAWADLSAAKRQELLRESVSEDVRFASPVTDQTGMDALTAHIEEFQRNYPGATFRTHTFLTHHHQMSAQWVMYAKDGSELIQGVSAAKFGGDGRLVELSGFWAA